MVSEPLDARRLETPLNLTPPTTAEIENELVEKIVQAVYSATNPVILVDVLTARFHCTPEVRTLVDITQFPVFDFEMDLILVIHDQSRQRNLERDTPNFCRCI